MYLNGIQHGIQSGHATDQLWAKYVRRILPFIGTWGGPVTAIDQEAVRFLHTLVEFASDHKTWIVMNGGDHEALVDLYNFLSNPAWHYPYSHFTEPGLNDAFSSVAVVIPERLYDTTAQALGKAVAQMNWVEDRNGACHAASKWAERMDAPTHAECSRRLYTAWEVEFLKRKHKCDLAR